MSWSNIIHKLSAIIKAKINSAVSKLDNREARLDLAVEEYKEAINMARRVLVLMTAKKNQIADYKKKVTDKMQRAQSRARLHLEKETEQGDRLAKLHLSTVAVGEATIVEWTVIEDNLKIQIENMEEEVLFASESVDALLMRIEMLKMREDVADVRKEIYEEITGLKESGNSLAETLKEYTLQVEEKEATAQALQEMIDAGMLPNVIEEIMPEPEVGRVDELMRELEEEIRIAETSELDPKEIEIYATTPLKKRKKKEEAVV